MDEFLMAQSEADFFCEQLRLEARPHCQIDAEARKRSTGDERNDGGLWGTLDTQPHMNPTPTT
jgi:hypothetical protein